MDLDIIGDHFVEILFAILAGPFTFGVVLTTVASSVVQIRRNGALMFLMA